MAKSKYGDTDAVRKKIEELFAYRKLNELLRIGLLDKNKKFVNHLVDIQTQIYMLDSYLEGHWELDKEKLKSYWDAIKASLRSLGYEDDEYEDLLKNIRQYEKIERQCRKDKWPTEVSFKKFYSTKSCDVRLIRHLIYQAAPSLKETWKESVWTYYDLITEINDDIADMEEDVSSYNGNRFLISILREGLKKTESRYEKFIGKAVKKANTYFEKHPKQEQHHELHDWIIMSSKETLDLLKSTVAKADIEHLSTALILKHMK